MSNCARPECVRDTGCRRATRIIERNRETSASGQSRKSSDSDIILVVRRERRWRRTGHECPGGDVELPTNSFLRLHLRQVSRLLTLSALGLPEPRVGQAWTSVVTPTAVREGSCRSNSGLSWRGDPIFVSVSDCFFPTAPAVKLLIDHFLPWPREVYSLTHM